MRTNHGRETPLPLHEGGERPQRCLLLEAHQHFGECRLHSHDTGRPGLLEGRSPGVTSRTRLTPTYLCLFSMSDAARLCLLPAGAAGAPEGGFGATLSSALRGGGLSPVRRGVWMNFSPSPFLLRHPETIYNSRNYLLTPAVCFSFSSGLCSI